MSKALAAATDPVAQVGANLALDDGGSATDAVVAGILAMGLVRSDVLLAPMVAMVGGVGAGTRCFDGRTTQPGRGAKRPRGWLPDEEIPVPASCSVPRSLALLTLLQAHSRQRPLSALIRAGRSVAKQHDEVEEGLEARLALLQLWPKHGAAVLTHYTRQLQAAAGPVAGGILSEDDLREVPPGDANAQFYAQGESEVAVPVLDGGPPVDPAMGERRARLTQVIVAADGRGLVAAVAFTPCSMGVRVAELGLRLPMDAVPVRRGVPRTTPGTPLWTPSPIAVVRRAGDGYFCALAVAGAAELPTEMPPLDAPLAEQLQGLKVGAQGATAVAASVERGRTSALVL